MSVTTRFKIEDPDKIVGTMSISMRLSDWKAVKKAIDGMKEYPSWDLSHEISKMISAVENTFYDHVEDK